MKKILVATIAAVAFSGAASAADMSMPMKAPAPMPAPAYNWTGCYLDAGGGAGMWNQSHYTIDNTTGQALTGEQTTGGRGWYGEVGGGCDYQFSLNGFGNFVIGVLGGYDFMSLKGSYTDTNFGIANGYEKETGAGFVGARIGYLITPNVLTYTSGGWTDARFNGFTASDLGTPVFSMPSHTYNGWFLGGGAETSLGTWLPQGFFLRTDYRWSTYNGTTIGYLNPTTGGPNGLSTRSNKYVQQVGTELIYRFNWH